MSEIAIENRVGIEITIVTLEKKWNASFRLAVTGASVKRLF
jgi:hypothetical protein